MNEEVKTSDNSEIDKALKEFEVKSAIPESYKAVKFFNQTDVPKMVQLVMKWSGIKEQKQAEYILLGLVVLMFALSFYFFFSGGNKQQKLTPAQLEQMKNIMPVIPTNR